MFAIRIPLLRDSYVVAVDHLHSCSWVTTEIVRIALILVATILGLASLSWRHSGIGDTCFVFALVLFVVAILMHALGPYDADPDLHRLPSTNEGDRLTLGSTSTSLRQSSPIATSILCCTSSRKQALEQEEQDPDCRTEAPLLRCMGDTADLEVPSTRTNEDWCMLGNERAASSQPLSDGGSTSYGTAGEQYRRETERKAEQDTNKSPFRRFPSIGEDEIEPVDIDLEQYKDHTVPEEGGSVRQKAMRGIVRATHLSLRFGQRAPDRGI